MHALSDRRIEAMAQRFAAASLPPAAADGVMLAFDIATAEMLAEPEVDRAAFDADGDVSTVRSSWSA